MHEHIHIAFKKYHQFLNYFKNKIFIIFLNSEKNKQDLKY